MDLSHVDRQTACRVQSPCASLALEVFGLLVIDEDFKIVEVPLAVIAPGPRKGLFDVRVLTLCFTHGLLNQRLLQRRSIPVKSVGKL